MGTMEKTFVRSCKVFMVFIIREDRWAVMRIVSRECMTGYGAETPADTGRSDDFLSELQENEKRGLKIHEHL